MKRKLSTKERDEVVTKGYLEDQDFVTKQYIEEQNFVTKDYLDMRLETFQKDMYQHITALMEHNREQTLVLIDAFQGRFERIERRLDIGAWGA